MAESEYLLTNANPETADRFGGLESTFDRLTIGHLSRLGVAPGGRCLEIGAGGGSIACWMAAQVGPTGRVLGVDLDTRWFQHDGSPQLEVRPLDLVEEAIPDGPWDLIHERLVLLHIPRRLEVLDRLVAALAPGGWIVVEDFDTAEVRTTDRDGPNHEFVSRMLRQFNTLLARGGAANSFAANAFRHLRDRGLVDVRANGHVTIETGGSDYSQVIAANTRQVWDAFVAQGVRPDELDRYLELLDDPDTIIGSPVLITVCGRRPA